VPPHPCRNLRSRLIKRVLFSTLFLLIRGLDNGVNYNLSIDHTWAEKAIRAGFPVEEIRKHPNRGVLEHYLGVEPTVEVDTRYRLAADGDETGDTLVDPLPLAPGDVLMLCSDGLADLVKEPDMVPALQSGNLGQAAIALVQRALHSGATDNVTVVVLRLAGGKSHGVWWWPRGH
jgi:PPM family protein phosphatase